MYKVLLHVIFYEMKETGIANISESSCCLSLIFKKNMDKKEAPAHLSWVITCVCQHVKSCKVIRQHECLKFSDKFVFSVMI